MNTKFLLLYIILFLSSGILSGQTTGYTPASFKVFGACDDCKERIEKSLQVKGIQKAIWDVDTKMLSLEYDPAVIELEKIHEKIAGVGHDTELKRAPDRVYNKLPACCKYRDDAHHIEHSSGKDVSRSVIDSVIRGVVVEEDNKGNLKPLPGASIYWAGTKSGTTSDDQGNFIIAKGGEKLVVSYAGYQPDTLLITDVNEIQIILASNNQLKSVTVTSSRRTYTYVNTVSAVRSQVITEKELFKAACCNLSESFETNPSVDVSYNDAITGSKQIQLLGLSGNYSQLTLENLPGPRGLATPLGLNSVPGTWVESIQLIKGTGSVINGFESIAGQINVELKKPNDEKLYVNAYVNDFGKTDLNVNLSHHLNEKWSTTLLLHDDFFNNNKLDHNKDGFRDLPTGNLFSGINRWHYQNAAKGIESQFGIKYMKEDRTGGQTGFIPSEHKLTTDQYGLGFNIDRKEAFVKIGYVFPEKKYKSVGLQLSVFDHQQDSYFGVTSYDGRQKNIYANLIYQSIINTTTHKFKTGLSYVQDEYEETFKGVPYIRTEKVPGAFFEYSFSPVDQFTLVAGVREDYNSLYGWFTTPRLNIRYEPVTGTVIRASAGRGQRTANIFAENNAVFISSRNLVLPHDAGQKAYGLDAEVAWNKGISIDQKFKLLRRDAMMSVDFFRNDFSSQVIADVEEAGIMKFYNLDGKSFSNSLQGELTMEPIRKLAVRMAYRYFDVRTTYSGKLMQRPLTAKHRGFVNLGYEVKSWKLDYTVSYNGPKRIPSTVSNPLQYQRADISPAYTLMNAQVTKSFGKKNPVEVYLGGENLGNFIQDNAIIAEDQPFGPYFDASLIWGTVSGRMIYGGLRWKLK